jgi:two-component system, NtrC family, sensor histidine kinase GlrK
VRSFLDKWQHSVRIFLNFSILSRLISSYLLIIFVVLLSGVYTISNLNELSEFIRTVTTNDTRMINLLEECQEILYKSRAAEEKYFVSRDVSYFQQSKDLEADFTRRMAELAPLADKERKQTLLGVIQTLHTRYGALFDDMTARIGKNYEKDPDFIRYRSEQEQIAAEAGQRLRELARVASEERDEKLNQIKVISLQTGDVILISLSLAVIMVIVISVINTRSVSIPISRLQEKTKAVAQGDFSDDLDIQSPPEIRELAMAFNTMCDRLRELDQMKIDYISHLSHELRTPLTAINVASSMLQEGTFAARPEKQQELQNLIREECERLIRSVNRLLDFSMMEAGMVPLSLQDSSLMPIVEKNMQRFSPLAQRKGIDLQAHIPQNLPPIRMDSEKIEVVIENLLSNALKFTSGGGRVTISAKLQAEARNIEVAVSDTGRGIPEWGLKEVFEKFKRVDDGKGAVRGTGLGLAIVKHIVNAHGGQVWAESEFGAGSTFTFSLPVSS